MIISQVKIIVFQQIINPGLWILYIARKDCSLFNKQKMHGYLEIRDLLLVLNMIFNIIYMIFILYSYIMN